MHNLFIFFFTHALHTILHFFRRRFESFPNMKNGLLMDAFKETPISFLCQAILVLRLMRSIKITQIALIAFKRT